MADSPSAESVPERIKTRLTRSRRLLDNGVRLAFGKPTRAVAPLNPLLGLYAATTRATLDDK